MSSIITAPPSTNGKLSVFDRLIKRGNAVLHSVFLLAGGSLSSLTYQTANVTGVVFGLGDEVRRGEEFVWC